MERVLVTNRHVAQCVAGRPDLYAKQPWVRVLRRSSEKYVDLALLELTDPVRARSIPVRARRPVKKGDLLYTVGPPDARWIDRYLYTMVRDWRIRTYRVAADPVHGGEGLDGVIVVEGQAFRGQSGAPVVTAEGEVVGTLYAATKTHAFIIPVEPYVDDLLGR
jgi:S1-C subfamily serine protease